jgi:Histidinol-phosphate/aromatic aminotransferase and cobyric acid decarboxylase
LPAGELHDFLRKVPPHIAVVLDEAYVEYIEPALRYDSMAWVREFPNLIVSRTFSKATAWRACAWATACRSQR